MTRDDAVWKVQPFVRRSGDRSWYVRFKDRDGQLAQGAPVQSRVFAFQAARKAAARGSDVVDIVGPLDVRIAWAPFSNLHDFMK
jgi:hypothetical protein